MASPFGIAYGIGAGLSGVPGAIMKGQDQAQQMSLKNLQLQDLQRKMQEEQAFNQVMSEKIAPPMVQAPVMEEMPRAMTAPDQAYEPAGTMQVPTGRTAPQQYEFGSQYEQQAYELSQRAERLRQMGLGRTAMKLQEEAMKYGSLHQESLGQDAASSIIYRPADAPAKLAKLGWPGVKRVGRDGDMFFIEEENGKFTTMDYNDLAALSAGKANLSSTLQRIQASDNQARSREFAAKEASRRAADNAKAAMARAEAAGQFRLEAERIKATRPVRGSGDEKDKWVQRVEYRAKELVRAAADRGEVLSPGAAMDQAFELIPPPGAGAAIRRGLTPAQELADIRKELLYMPADDPRRPALEARVAEIRSSGRTPETVIPKPKPPKVDIKTERAKAAFAIAQNPANAAKIKEMFKSRTGEAY